MTSVGFRAVVDPDVAARYRAQGWWGDRTVADFARDHAAARADDPAYITEGHRLTWGALEEASNRLAGRLVSMGAAPGDRVAMILPDGPTIHVAFLAAEKAGLTVVGIGARAGNREIRHLVGKTGASLLVTADGDDRGLGLQHLSVPRFEVEGPDALDAEPISPDEMTARRIGPDDLFLVNSTSGTTGLPKCVMHHQNRWFFFHQKAVEHGALTSDEVFISPLPAPFGFGLWTSHVTPIILGVPTVVTERFSPSTVLELVERERVTVLCCVSTQFIMLLESPDLDRRDLSSLRVMWTGGETVPYDRASAFEQRTGATVLQFYGSNETGMLSGSKLGDPLDVRVGTAGALIPEMRVRLFDPATGAEVATPGTGQPGCLGPATSVGYLDDEAANARLFTPDGWMLMGDLVSVDDAGLLRVVGRTSDIIIRGGKNISAAQVEAEVGTHPAVALAAAVPMEDDIVGERVCVYAQLRPGASLTLDALVEHLLARGASKETLPEHLILMDELPTSSGGKVAKGELREDIRRRRAEEG